MQRFRGRLWRPRLAAEVSRAAERHVVQSQRRRQAETRSAGEQVAIEVEVKKKQQQRSAAGQAVTPLATNSALPTSWSQKTIDEDVMMMHRETMVSANLAKVAMSRSRR